MKHKIKEKPLIYNKKDGGFIAYHKHKGNRDRPGVVFLGGFLSDMNGAKALALQDFCEKEKINFIRFDYGGHGESSGKFEDGSISDWKKDALLVLDEIAEGKQILVGSSMGGWIMLLLALQRPRKISALLGIAAAPDFTEYLVWDKLSKAQKAQIRKKGIIHIPSDDYCGTYPITKKLIEDGRKNLLGIYQKEARLENCASHQPAKRHPAGKLENFPGDKIRINLPIKLIHGIQDEDVPYQTSITLAERIASDDVEVILKKDGSHRMSEPEDLELIEQTLAAILNSYG